MLTDLFADINAAGYRVNNLFQTLDMQWQCNLHRIVEQKDLGDFTCFARGATPEEAVEAAVKQMVRPEHGVSKAAADAAVAALQRKEPAAAAAAVNSLFD